MLAALGAEFADELVDGTKSAALPLIRDSLDLSYGQVGLLAAVPLIAGSLIELPVGVLAGAGRRRRRVVLAGGLVFIASAAGGRGGQHVRRPAGRVRALLPGLRGLRRPDRGAAAGRRPGAPGAVHGPLDPGRGAGRGRRPGLLAAVVAAGGSWRTAYVVTALAAAAAWLGLAARPAAAGRRGSPARRCRADAAATGTRQR